MTIFRSNYLFQLQLFFFAPLWRMGPRCSSAETQVCHRSYIIAARYIAPPKMCDIYLCITITGLIFTCVLLSLCWYLRQYAHRFFHLGVHVPFYLHFLNKVVSTFEKHIFLSQTDLTRTGIISNSYNEMFEV
jgi:hypothetical protein